MGGGEKKEERGCEGKGGRWGEGRVKGGDIAHTDVHTVLMWVIVLNDF